MELSYQIAGHGGPVLIHNYGFYIINVKAQGVSEHENQEKRDKEGEIQAPEIPYQMIEFLPGDGFHIYRVQFSLRAMSLIKTALRSASGLSGKISVTIWEGVPETTILPWFIITILPQ